MTMQTAVSVLASLLPYSYFASLSCMYLFDPDSDLLIFGFFAVFFVLSIVTAVLYAYFGSQQKALWVKVSALPADAAAIIFTAIRVIENRQAVQEGAMGVGLSIFALILFLTPYLLSRIGLLVSGAVVCGRTSRVKKPLHILLHLLPIADIISAAMLHKGQYKA